MSADAIHASEPTDARAPALEPAFASASPIAAFDQRVGAPGLISADRLGADAPLPSDTPATPTDAHAGAPPMGDSASAAPVKAIAQRLAPAAPAGAHAPGVGGTPASAPSPGPAHPALDSRPAPSHPPPAGDSPPVPPAHAGITRSPDPVPTEPNATPPAPPASDGVQMISATPFESTPSLRAPDSQEPSAFTPARRIESAVDEPDRAAPTMPLPDTFSPVGHPTLQERAGLVLDEPSDRAGDHVEPPGAPEPAWMPEDLARPTPHLARWPVAAPEVLGDEEVTLPRAETGADVPDREPEPDRTTLTVASITPARADASASRPRRARTAEAASVIGPLRKELRPSLLWRLRVS